MEFLVMLRSGVKSRQKREEMEMKKYYSNGGSYMGSCTKNYKEISCFCPENVNSCDDCYNCIANAIIIEGEILPSYINIEGMEYKEITEKEYQKYII
jgi:hypothetical protein